MNRNLTRRVFRSCTSVASLILASLAGAQTALTVDDAVKEGLQNNPQAAAALAGVRSALASYRSLAVLSPVTLGASHIQGTSTAPTLNGTNNDTFLDLGETVDLSGQRRYQAAGANATYKSTLYQYQETLLGLEQQIRDAYWSLAAAQSQTRFGIESLKEAQHVYDLTVKQQQAGASPTGDVVRSSIDVANAKQSLITAQSAERTALFAFNTLLAKPPSTPETLAEDFSHEPVVVLPRIEELGKQSQENRPLLKSAQEQSNAAKYPVRQAEASHWPDLTVDFQRSTTQEINSLIFGLSFPLLDFGSVSQSVRAAKETRKQVQAQEVQTQQQVAQQVAQAHADLESALQAASSYKKEILDPSETLLTMARLGYSQGATGILPVIDAESTIRNARVGYINALLAVYKAQDEVLAATGTRPSGAPVSTVIKP